MPDQFSEVTTQGFGSRIINSIGGVLIGFLLFIISFVVLYWNEGRIDLSKVAKTAPQLQGTVVNQDATLNDKLVAVTGSLTSEDTLGDEIKLDNGAGTLVLNKGDYIAVQRDAQIFAWVENKQQKSEKNLGGSETTQTTYTYEQKWVDADSATDSSNFKSPEGHQNPGTLFKSSGQRVSAAKVDAYTIDIKKIDLPNFNSLSLSAEMVTLPPNASLTSDNAVYIGKGTAASPQLGDMRASYQVVAKNAKVTAFGRLDGSTINPYQEGKVNLYRLFDGTKTEAVATLHGEYTTLTWILRAVGFLMMWFGMMLFFGPLSTFLDIVPVFGSLSSALIAMATFAVALPLSLVTIVVSMIVHSIVAVIIAGVVVMGLLIVVMKGIRKNKAAAA